MRNADGQRVPVDERADHALIGGKWRRVSKQRGAGNLRHDPDHRRRLAAWRRGRMPAVPITDPPDVPGPTTE